MSSTVVVDGSVDASGSAGGGVSVSISLDTGASGSTGGGVSISSSSVTEGMVSMFILPKNKHPK